MLAKWELAAGSKHAPDIYQRTNNIGDRAKAIGHNHGIDTPYLQRYLLSRAFDKFDIKAKGATPLVSNVPHLYGWIQTPQTAYLGRVIER